MSHINISRHPDHSALLAHLMTTPTWGPLAAMLEAVRALDRLAQDRGQAYTTVRTAATIAACHGMFACEAAASAVRMAAVDWLAHEIGGGLETLRADQVIRLALRDAEVAHE